MAKRETSIENMKGPYRVKRAKALRWPRWLAVAHYGVVRGQEGYVVDLDLPYEQILCRNQAQALEPAPGASPSPIEHRPALVWLRNNGYMDPRETMGKVRVKDAVADREKLAGKDKTSDLPGLDQPPGGAKPRKSKTLQEADDAVEGQAGSPKS